MSSESSPVEPPLIAPKKCSRCSAVNPPHARACWLCNAPLLVQEDRGLTNPYAVRPGAPLTAAPLTPSESSPAQARVESVFLVLLVAIVVLSAMVAVGIGAQDRGLLILFAIVMLPALSAAGIRGLYSVAKGETPKPSKMFMTFIYSALLTFGLGALLVISSIIFLFMMCAQMLGGGPR